MVALPRVGYEKHPASLNCQLYVTGNILPIFRARAVFPQAASIPGPTERRDSGHSSLR